MEHYITFVYEYPGTMITEHLRYAGVIDVTGDGHTGYVPHEVGQALPREQPDEVLVTIGCPRLMRGGVWAEGNLARLGSFGVPAAYWTRSRNHCRLKATNGPAKRRAPWAEQPN